MGGDVAGLHQAFMASAGHRANILGDYNYVGVGTAFSADDYLYVTVIFMKGPDDLLAPKSEDKQAPEADPAPKEEAAKPETSKPQAKPTEKPPTPVPTAPAPAPEPEPEPLPRPGWTTKVILDLVATGNWPVPLEGGLTLF